MLKYIIENKKPLFWVIFHVLLGGLCILSPWFLIVWFYFVLISSLPGILKENGRSLFEIYRSHCLYYIL